MRWRHLIATNLDACHGEEEQAAAVYEAFIQHHKYAPDELMDEATRKHLP